MQFRKWEGRLLPLLNLLILVMLHGFLLFNAILNVVGGIAPLLIRIPQQAQNGCNGYPELCSRKYSNITQIGTHGSAFTGILPWENQNVDITTQLNAGIRFLQAQTHRNAFGALSLCHTSCMVNNAGSVQGFLRTVKDWLDTHPQEIVTLLLTNGDRDRINASDFDHAFTASEIKPYAYIPKNTGNFSVDLSITSWPTLGEMITSGKRLVAFVDYGSSPLYPYILGEFHYFWETPFDTIDRAFSQCTTQRILPVANPNMYILNHFLDTQILKLLVPDRRDASHTNAAAGTGSIGAQVELCKKLHGYLPRVILVDYFERGDVFKVQRSLNGLNE
ncbi:hypothetical protein MMC07_009054 [Pseudocyphellaria aurata]|nr:hypothetical protein [Pseudocyphellaria aurata]